MTKIFISFIAAVTVSLQAFAMGAQPPVVTVASVDIQKYLGKWYEFAAIPQGFEKQCVGDTNAQYATTSEGLISVVNTCDTASGVPSVANGRAKIIDLSTNAKLKVTFVDLLGWQFLFGGDYWILGLGENYSYAVVGAPGRDYAWILSRTPALTSEQVREASQVLTKQGFDICKLVTTIQSSGLREKVTLCQLLTNN